MNKLVITFFLSLLLLTSSAEGDASWIISPGYLQSYSHHYHFKYTTDEGERVIITNKDFTPLYFYIWTTELDSYSYVIENYSRVFQYVTIKNVEVSGNRYTLPIGDLPIILPTKYNGVKNWVDHYQSQLINLSGIPKDLIGLKNSSISVIDGATTFLYLLIGSTENLDMTGDLQINQYLRFLKVIFSLVNFRMTNVTFSLSMKYIKRSGVLESYSLYVNSEKAFNGSSVLNNLELTYEMIFAITLPPLNSETIDYPVTWLIPLFIYYVSAFSRRRS